MENETGIKLQFKEQRNFRKKTLSLVEGSSTYRATLGKPTYQTFPYKALRVVYVRNKTFSPLEGSPFCDGRVTLLAGPCIVSSEH